MQTSQEGTVLKVNEDVRKACTDIIVASNYASTNAPTQDVRLITVNPITFDNEDGVLTKDM